MEKTTDSLAETHPHGNYHSYLLGFGISIILTLIAFFLVYGQLLSGWYLNLAIVFLGLLQAWVQLDFFLHLGEEAKPQWNFFSFLFMIVVVFILVAGSLWIMYNLMDRTMPAMQMTSTETMQT